MLASHWSEHHETYLAEGEGARQPGKDRCIPNAVCDLEIFVCMPLLDLHYRAERNYEKKTNEEKERFKGGFKLWE
jgi:hypothetical protein